MKILITGGAGFIGSRLASKLSSQGASVSVVDNLSEQIHGVGADFSDSLIKTASCFRGDICDKELMTSLVRDQEVIIHLAAETGTGQSMYEVERYSQVNLQGTAVLLDILINQRPESLRKLVVASSRAVYGEGQYHCKMHGTVYPTARTAAAMSAGVFDPVCPHCGNTVSVESSSESTPFGPSSFYGLTKQVQEQMVLMFASAMGIDGFALRYQNVYGPGQSLNNPYTGILAVFSNLVRQGKALNIFEDGLESRDFVYIEDVIDATAACVSPNVHGVMALNVGSGVRTSVLDVAQAIAEYFQSDVPMHVTGAFRVGDIRHNVADLSRIQALTAFQPHWYFRDGLKQFLDWACDHSVSDTGFDRSLKELADRGLMGTGLKA